MFDADSLSSIDAAAFDAPAFAEPRRRPAILRFVAELRRRLRARAEMRDLALRQPDSVLEDVGISRAEAWREARKPLWRR